MSAPTDTVGTFSNWLATQSLDHDFGVAPLPFPAALYLGLFTGSVSVPVEVSAPDYVRQPITFNPATGTPPIVTNTANVVWAPAQQDWGNVVVGGVFDAPVGGNFYGWGYLVAADGVTPVSLNVLAGDNVKIPAGQVVIELNAPAQTGISDAPADGNLYGRQNAAWAQIIGLSPEANVLDFHADPTGLVDSSTAIQAALNTAKNVYLPAGTYRLNFGITVGQTTVAQRLRGDGLQTELYIDQAFDPTNTNGVITLQGREENAPTIQDIRINFAQPTNAFTRAGMKTLANGGTSGASGTGIMYPPAIYFGLANRFHLTRIRIENAWDGIAQGTSPSNSGGWWMDDIEVGAYDVGLAVGINMDFSHIQGWHAWNFGMNSNQQTVAWDGNCIGMHFGAGNKTPSGANIADVTLFRARFVIDGNQDSIFASNLMLDGDSSTLQINDCSQIQIVNLYLTCPTTGPNSGLPSINMLSPQGFVKINGLWGWPGSTGQPFVNMAGGILSIAGGYLASGGLNQIIKQTAGILSVTGVQFGCTYGIWTTPPVHVSGGSISFSNNNAGGQSPTGQTFLQIDHDSAGHSVVGAFLDGQWSFTPPPPGGSSGSYLGMYLYSPVNQGGPTSGRPASPAPFQRYCDTTLGFPVWWFGSNWVNAAGAVS